MIAEVHKFRAPNKAYIKPLCARARPRWHTVYKDSKGYYVMLRMNKLYESNWVYYTVGNKEEKRC